MTGSNSDKTGTVFTGVSHGICALIGAGVLALPQAVAWMGWLGGLLCMFAFYFVQWAASYMLASMYEVDGKKHGRYQDAVAAFLGWRGQLAVTICQSTNIVAFSIAYTITAAVSMQEMSQHICSDSGTCINSTWALALIFGGIQLFCSQLPNLESAWWMSTLGAAMSIGYAGIALGLCIASAGNGHGTLSGIQTTTPDKIFGVANALGSIAFAFSFSVILLEIQDTLREPPKAVRSMRRVIDYSLGISMAFYLAISITGYLAFGNSVPGDVLTGFSGPSWLVTVANGMVVVHMVSAYQVYTQPLFVLVEWEIWVRLLKKGGPKSRRSVTSPAGHHLQSALGAVHSSGTIQGAVSVPESAGSNGVSGAPANGTAPAAGTAGAAADGAQLPASPFANREASLPNADAMKRLAEEEEAEKMEDIDLEQPPPLSPDLSFRRSVRSMRSMHFHISPAPLWLRLIWRSSFVLATTMVAVVMPFFSNFVGLIGGLMFWPLSVGFPLGMWLVARKPTGWRRHGLVAVAGIMLLVGLAAVIGAVRNIIVSFNSFTIF